MTEQMTMLFTLTLSGAAIWGLVNVIKSHLLRNKNIHEDVVVVGTMLGASLVAFLIQFIWDGVPHGRIMPSFWLPFAVTALLNIGIQYFSVKALKIEDASVVIPLAATMPIFVIFMSWFLLGEWPTFLGRVGIGLIAIGSYILYLKGSPVAMPKRLEKIVPERLRAPVLFYGAPWLRLFSSNGARLALLTAYLGAVAVNFDKLAVLEATPMLFSGSVFLVVGVFVWIWSATSGRWQTLDKSNFKIIFLVGMLLGVGAVIMNGGYIYGIAPYVGTLKRTQIFWTLLFAALFLAEKHTAIRLVGATIMFFGVALVAF
ncbi:MAG: DMT family transporter [Patescibacteria group bacterium]